MIQRDLQIRDEQNVSQPKWFHSPVEFHKGNFSEIRQHIPSFERRSFGLIQPDMQHSTFNENLDLIVRLPQGEDNNYIPIGVVSKEYSLVQHTEILDKAIAGLKSAKIEEAELNTEIQITKYGERMHLSIYLPIKYRFDPGDENPMDLRLEIMNSVDGSTRFRCLMGWYRLVCSNGLIIGVTQSDIRRRHSGDLKIEDIGNVLAAGIGDSKTEKENFIKWRETKISIAKVAEWADNQLYVKMGFKAATRAFHIAKSGRDVEIIGPYKDNVPTSISVVRSLKVPGAPEQCTNLFDVSQILAWLAKERRDIQEQIEWREQIPKLMESLLN